MAGSKLENDFLLRIKALGWPMPEKQYKFHPTRKWKFDFAYVDEMVAFECDGGTWTNGRHTRGAGFEKDCEKINEAQRLGWKVFRFTATHLRNGYCTTFLESLNK